MIESITTSDAPAAVGPYSQAIATPALVFCSGQVAIEPASGGVLEGDISVQAEQALRNLEAVLAAAGLALSDVVKTTCFLRDLNDYAAFNAVYARFFEEPWPARTTIEAGRLPLDVDVEIDAIALRR